MPALVEPLTGLVTMLAARHQQLGIHEPTATGITLARRGGQDNPHPSAFPLRTVGSLPTLAVRTAGRCDFR